MNIKWIVILCAYESVLFLLIYRCISGFEAASRQAKIVFSLSIIIFGFAAINPIVTYIRRRGKK